MLRYIKRLFLPFVLLSVLTIGHLASCSQYDTFSEGVSFAPVNSQVRAFTHLVYVEYSSEGVRVWGPCSGEVQASIEGLHVTLQNDVDSIAIIAYGFPAGRDRDNSGSLTIQSDRSYALYLNNLNLSSSGRPVISCHGSGICYMVLPEKSKNELSSKNLNEVAPGDGCICAEGKIVLGGTGKLAVRNLSNPEPDHYTHAISAEGFQCQYKVDVTLESLAGDGIHVKNSMRCSMGSWTITAGRDGVYAGDSIVLYDGTYSGSAAEGSFLHTDLGAAFCTPTVTAASGDASDIMDISKMVLMFDTIQSVWQEQFFGQVLEADSAYQLVDTAGVVKASIKYSQTIQSPYVLISNATIASDAELTLKKK